jgi:hypothetical protein
LGGNDAILAQCAGAIVLGTIIINVTDPFLPMDWSQLAAGQGEFYIKVCYIKSMTHDLRIFLSEIRFRGRITS